MIDDRELEIPQYNGACSYCRRLRNRRAGRTCDAFPDGIPLEIWNGKNTHQQPYPGDRGVRFSPVNELAQEKVNALRSALENA